MGLINLRTNLKDLKFGNDEPRGGNSNQPFIQTRVPATDEPLQTGISNAGPVIASIGAGAVIGAIGGSVLGGAGTGAVIGAAAGLGIGIAGADLTGNGLRLPSAGTGGPDFLIRGGTLLPGILANDAIRLTKYFASTEGVLFTVKQNLLSRIDVKTQYSPKLLNGDVYTPLSTLSQAIGNTFGVHVNKQGLNPFVGIGDSYTPNKYFTTISDEITNSTQNEYEFNNRLAGLYNIKILKTEGDYQNLTFYEKNNIPLNNDINLLSYPGGPNSFLGIGKTNIRYATNNIGAPLSVSNVTKDLNNPINNVLDYKQLGEISGIGKGNIENFKSPTVVDFRKKLKQELNKTIFSNAPSYDPGENKIIEQRVNLGDPGNSFGKNLSSYTKGIGESSGSLLYGAASQNSIDRINALEIYQSESPNDELGNDLVKFRIGVINNNKPDLLTYIHFRAFLDQISDNYSSNWEAIKYIGRGENFYTYNGFDRKVSLGWTVAAQSKAELIPMYKKLNYLASVCAPDYSENGYMRGNIVTLTIGGYFYEQPGIITSLNYEMNDENSSWEIGINDEGVSDPSVKELPHLIRVTGFNFIPIHQFVPRKQQNKFNGKGILTEYGNEHYIALSAGGKPNYEVQSI